MRFFFTGLLICCMAFGASPIYATVTECTTSIGSGTNQIDIVITINDVSNVVNFKITGPETSWFGVGYSTSSMYPAYMTIMNTTAATAEERNSSAYAMPALQGQQDLTAISTSVSGGRMTVDFDRALNTGDPNDYTFSTALTSLNIIWAAGSSSTFGYHGSTKGITSLSCMPLPVEFVRFEATLEDYQTVLSWITASEKNNAGFEVERSTDAKQWSQIGFVEGQGSTTLTKEYTFIDESPKPGVNYYRLKQVDFDNQFAYSSVRTVDAIGMTYNKDVVVSPNPTDGPLRIDFGQEVPEETRVIVYSSSLIPVRNIFVDAGNRMVDMDINELPPGMYFIMVKNKRWNSTSRIVLGNE